MTTSEHAEQVANIATEVIFDKPNKISDSLNRDSLVRNIRQAILKKLVLEDTDILDEDEFIECLNASKRDNLINQKQV